MILAQTGSQCDTPTQASQRDPDWRRRRTVESRLIATIRTGLQDSPHCGPSSRLILAKPSTACGYEMFRSLIQVGEIANCNRLRQTRSLPCATLVTSHDLSIIMNIRGAHWGNRLKMGRDDSNHRYSRVTQASGQPGLRSSNRLTTGSSLLLIVFRSVQLPSIRESIE